MLTTLAFGALIVAFMNLGSGSGVADYNAQCPEVNENYTACITIEAIKQGKKTGPQQALNDLEDYFATIPYKIDCHVAYHSVGSAFYREFNEKSYVENINGCYGAYYHGLVIETSNTYEGNIEDYAASMMKFCKTFTDLNFIYCVHGIGHGAYYVTERDYNKVEEICKQTGRAVDCGAGLFMEIVKDESKTTEFGMETFENFQSKNCPIFTTDILYTACHIMTHFGVNVDQGNLASEICSYGDKEENDNCKLYYGAALTVSLLDYYPEYETTELSEKYIKNIQDCLRNEMCYRGWSGTAYSVIFDKNKALKYCENLAGRYGTQENVDFCVVSKIPTRFS